MTYSLTIYITNNCFFFTWKKGAGTPYRRVPSQKSPDYRPIPCTQYHDILSFPSFFYPTSFPPNQSHLSSLIPFNLVHFHPIPYIPMHSNLISSIQSHSFNLIHRRRTGAEFGGRKTISQTKISE